jgi:hypothetical protein
MSVFKRRFLLIVGMILVGGGCNPLLFPFIINPPESRIAPSYKQLTIGQKEKKREPRVAILAYSGLDFNMDFPQADREISRLLGKAIQDQAKHNEEKLTVISPLKVDEYKNNHPDWHHEHVELSEIGRDLHVDYVIYLELRALSLYQPGSGGTFYRGDAKMDVTLVNVNKEDDFESGEARLFTHTYPSEGRGGNVPVDADTTPAAFRQQFLSSLAKRLSWWFVAHPTADNQWVD